MAKEREISPASLNWVDEEKKDRGKRLGGIASLRRRAGNDSLG
jgi:hypothetical protein